MRSGGAVVRGKFGAPHPSCFFAKSAEWPENKRDRFFASAKKCKKVQKSAQEYEKKRVEWREARMRWPLESERRVRGGNGALGNDAFRPSRNVSDRTEIGRPTLRSSKHAEG